jgi:hypothetical protein
MGTDGTDLACAGDLAWFSADGVFFVAPASFTSALGEIPPEPGLIGLIDMAVFAI